MFNQYIKIQMTLATLLLVANFISPVFASDADNDKLKQVQQKIKQQRQAIKKQLSEKNDLQSQFKATELEVAEVALQLTQTNNSLKDVNQKITKLEKEQNKLLIEKKQHQGLLSELIKTAYLSGKHDYTKLLLNQDDPAKLERLITYYKSLNNARVDQLEQIQNILNRLAEIEQQLSQQHNELIDLKASQQQDKKQLAKLQKSRKTTLNKLNSSIKTDKQRLEKLEQDQVRLTNAIENAQRNAKISPENLAGLYRLKKKLKWPTKGNIRKRFGQNRSGALRWKGVMMNANLGNRVNSIAEGIVLYADWLKGFGWVTVIDHGKGYMSLYGHNQALLKSVGDYVEQNEPIALIGQSGGQNRASLYFEIRYKGKTVDPARWCR